MNSFSVIKSHSIEKKLRKLKSKPPNQFDELILTEKDEYQK